MRIINYFRELLATLKCIRDDLSVIRQYIHRHGLNVDHYFSNKAGFYHGRFP